MSASDVVDALAGLDRAFRSLGIRWYVFGAQAVVLYGVPRLTADLDVTAEADPLVLGSLVERLADEGFEPRPRDLDAFVRKTRVVPVAHVASGLPVDIVLAGPGLEQEFLAGARQIRVGEGITVPVIAPEDLVVTKILAGRAKDLDDVRGILREQAGGLDLARSRRYLKLLEEALDRRDLLATLERLESEPAGESG